MDKHYFALRVSTVSRVTVRSTASHKRQLPNPTFLFTNKTPSQQWTGPGQVSRKDHPASSTSTTPSRTLSRLMTLHNGASTAVPSTRRTTAAPTSINGRTREVSTGGAAGTTGFFPGRVRTGAETGTGPFAVPR